MRRIIFILFVLSAACKEAYDPPVISTSHAYLVVDGFIGVPTSFTLTRSYKLNDTVQVSPPELNAQVSVQGSDSSVYPLTELGNGNYQMAGLLLNEGQLYRLVIVTSDGKLYRSDFVPAKNSAPLDSLNWINTANGLQLYVSTHDPQSNSHYYRWTYSETWEFHSAFQSDLKYENGDLQNRSQDPGIYHCWQTDNSDRVILGSSAKLARDEIYEAPLLLLPPGSPKMGVRYSILVRQYVLSPEAYNFWLNLQTNTEQIGSLFSPQPTTARGNLHCITDSTERVIGYVGAGNFYEERFFIDPNTIPNWDRDNYLDNCVKTSTSIDADSLSTILGSGYNLPINYPSFGRVSYSEISCVDCTLRGTNIKPTFWP